MGEIAEAMLDGTLCAGCGEFLGQDAGFPIYCTGCRPPAPPVRNRGRKRELDGQSALPRFSPYSVPPRTGTIQCAHCPRWIKPIGMAQHMRDKHPEIQEGKN